MNQILSEELTAEFKRGVAMVVSGERGNHFVAHDRSAQDNCPACQFKLPADTDRLIKEKKISINTKWVKKTDQIVHEIYPDEDSELDDDLLTTGLG